jgi:hypothetical protein
VKEIGGLDRARLQFAIADRRRLALGVAVGDVADGDLFRIQHASAGNPVVQIPGEDPLIERHALEFFDVLQRSKRRVGRLHWRSVPECRLGHYINPAQSARPRITVARRNSLASASRRPAGSTHQVCPCQGSLRPTTESS